MYLIRAVLAAVVVMTATAAQAATILINELPAGFDDALATPGRQIVGGAGPEVAFDPATDVFVIDPTVFGVDEILFANSETSGLPASGVNVIVVRNPDIPFAAGLAANAIAAQITAPGPGFFVYFNTGLDVARLVFSQDLSDATADLAILARLTHFSGESGRAELSTITAENFDTLQVPEPSSLMLFGAALAGIALRRRPTSPRLRS